jgi:chaperonin GroES
MDWLTRLLQREIDMDFKPMADRVVVRLIEPETKTASGIFIPDSTVEAANKGTVVAVGPGKVLKDGRIVPVADIVINDVIMFGPGAGIPVKVNGDDFLVLKEDEILAIAND